MRSTSATPTKDSVQVTQSAVARLACVVATTTLLSGCAVWDKGASSKPEKSGWSISKMWKQEYQVPHSMAVIWSPDILTLPGKPPTRGFGGRVYLYNERSQAIPVDGELIVHGYTKPPRRHQEQVAADKTFGFTAEQLTSHFSPSELGASYSIWIPWDAADGQRQEITLIPTFKGTEGEVVQGAAAKLFLPGAVPGDDNARVTLPVQSVSYRESSSPTVQGELPKGSSGMRTTTIDVPDSSALVKNKRTRETYTLGNRANRTSAVQQRAAYLQATQASMSQLPMQQLPTTMRAPAQTSTGRSPQDLNTRVPSPGNLLPSSLPALPGSLPTPPAESPLDVRPPASQPQELNPPMKGLNLKSPIAHRPFSMHDDVQPASFVR